jgi:small subunit ribosomal protein S1
MNTEDNIITPADAPDAPVDHDGLPAAAATAVQAEGVTQGAPQDRTHAGSPAVRPDVTAQSDDAAPSRAAEGADAEGAPAIAAPRSRDDDWSELPGDDIGNRLPGGLPPDDIGNRKQGGAAWRGPSAAKPGPAKPAAAAAPSESEGGPAKKKRRRRRRKGAEAQPDAETAGAPLDAAAEDETAGEDGDADPGEAEEEHAQGAAEGDQAQPEGEKRKRRKGHGAAPSPRERPAFSIGEEVFGKVSKVTEHAIWIDIAGKATGLFDRREIVDDDPPAEGDQFIATVASTGVRGGMLLLSRAPVQLDTARARLEAALKSEEPVDGFVTGAVKGGLEVDLGGLRAFAPASHVDLRHGADLNFLVGQRLDFIVTQFAKKGRDIVVSRRKMLEEESRKARAEALSALEPGTIHKGIVRKVVAWGVFVALPDAGNVEGLVHMTEASHDRGTRLTELFKSGAEIEVKVVRIDEKGKLWLSRKAVTADPWDTAQDSYAIGSRHKGKVARLQPFGAFIELEPGIDGLIHTADLSMKPIQHPSEVVKIGDDIDVVVSNCDVAGRRIGLHPAPPEGEEVEPRQRVQQGKTVKVAVTQITDGGLVVRVLGVTGRGARAFIPAGHTATQRGTDLRKEFPIGTQLEAKVIEVDPRRGEAKLSIRALKEDAEKQAYQQYRAGVAREAKFGTFADLMKKS